MGWKAKAETLAVIRLAGLAVLWVAGLLSIVATTGEQVEKTHIGTAAQILERSTPAAGPYAIQIEQKKGEIAAYTAAIFVEGSVSSTRIDPTTGFMAAPPELTALENQRTKARAELAELIAKNNKAMSAETGSCFTADMQVLTESGAKPIAEIKAGDRVLSRDDAGRQVVADVLRTYADSGDHFLLINGRIKVTALHRFFTDKGWKRSRDLMLGDRIQTHANLFEEVVALEWFARDLEVYNLTISGNHNFYVSADGRNGYLVHNTAGGGGGGK